MKRLFLFIFISITVFTCNQKSNTITTTETVEILNNNSAEALFYFENNWKVLREKAKKRDYLASFEIIETEYSESAPFHIKLVTIYKNKTQYNERELHFAELIKESGGLKLLNNKKPNEFRKSVNSYTIPKDL